MKFEFNVDYDTFIALQKDYYMHSKTIKRDLRIYQWLLPSLSFLFTYIFVIETKDLIYIIVALFTAFICFWCLPFFMRYLYIITAKFFFRKPRYANLMGKAIITITEEGIEKKEEHVTSQFKWSLITHVREDQKLYFLYLTDAKAIILPKVPSLNPADKEIYQKYVEQYIKPLIKETIRK